VVLECDDEENSYSQTGNKTLAIHSTAYEHQTLAAHLTVMNKIKLINTTGKRNSIFFSYFIYNTTHFGLYDHQQVLHITDHFEEM
jgi:hypothetical protein